MTGAYRENLTSSQAFLTLAVQDMNSRTEQDRERLAALYQRIGDEVAWQAASANRIVSTVAHALMEAQAEGLSDRWGNEHKASEHRTIACLSELDRLSCLLDKSGVSIALVEHGSTARAVYPCRGCFSSKDLDTLVCEEQMPVVHKFLLAEGYIPVARRLAAVNRQEYSTELEPGLIFWLNVQWRPLVRIWAPAVERLSTAELLERSQPTADPNSCVRILSPEDNLLLCALHASIHGYVRPPGIRLHLDVDRIAHRVPINWDVFLRRVFALKCRHRVYLSLAIPRVLLGTPVPEEVLCALVPSSKKRRHMLDWATEKGFFEDGRPKFSRADFARLELMLCDDGPLRGLAQVIFPPPAWMKQRYHPSSNWSLAYLYAKRLATIALTWAPQ